MELLLDCKEKEQKDLKRNVELNSFEKSKETKLISEM